MKFLRNDVDSIQKTFNILQEIKDEVEKRYEEFKKLKVKDIVSFLMSLREEILSYQKNQKFEIISEFSVMQQNLSFLSVCREWMLPTTLLVFSFGPDVDAVLKLNILFLKLISALDEDLLTIRELFSI